jgi:DNA polymerase-3 subunit gamma/tau
VEQKAATNLLRLSFTEGRLGQAYLFSGPRGCGKTTAARILAKVVNCEAPKDGEPCCVCKSCVGVSAGEHLDVMEIDGASNRGIDQIRELKSHVGLAPFMGGSKVYILDEVHMLTTEAFNALLKTLEEPPPFALFIFATTEPNKVPVTIRSRCQHIPFHRITAEGIALHLRNVAAMEGFEADAAALWEIARNADGALRDALSLTEQALALGGGKLTAASVNDLLGGGGRVELERFASLLRTSPADAAAALKGLLERGVSPERFLDALFPLFRDMWVYSLWGEGSFSGLTLSEEEKKYLVSEVPGWSSGTLGRLVSVCASLFPRVRQGLRADVFSGLLVFGLIGAMSEDAAGTEAPVHSTGGASNRFEPAETTAHTHKMFQKQPAGGKAASDERVAALEAGGSDAETVSAWEGIFSRLWESDLSLCAAIIDAELSAEGGELVIDCSAASSVAKAVLESARAKSALARAFGIENADSPLEVSQADEKTAARSAPPASRTAPGAMSMEELSSFLGADLLMAKPVGEADIGDLGDDMSGADLS